MHLPVLKRLVLPTKLLPRLSDGRLVDRARAIGGRLCAGALRAVVAAARVVRSPRGRARVRSSVSYRLFRLDRAWATHRVLRRVYPKPGLPRRIAVTTLAFVLAGTGFLAYMHARAQADWYDTGWVYRKAITINHTKVPSTQTDFPVLVSITDSSLAANAKQLGEDIVFTSSNGITKLSHEIESYASASGQLVAWVKIPSLSSTADTTIYMYYGNQSASSQQDVANVWDTNFKLVYHMNGSAASLPDSTTNAKVLNKLAAGEPATATGVIGGAQNYDGSNDRSSTVTSPGLPTGDFTYETWAYFDSTTTYMPLFDVQDTGTGGNEFAFIVDNTIDVHTNGSILVGSQDYFPTTNAWTHLVVTRSGSTVRIYMNGLQDSNTGTDGTALNYGTCSLHIGVDADTTSCSGSWFAFLNGLMDEVRVSSTARSQDWIATEYNNQSSPSTFLTLGNQQQKKNPVLLWKFDDIQTGQVNIVTPITTTGFQTYSANAAVSSGAGDNDGFEGGSGNSPQDATTDNGGYLSDANTGDPTWSTDGCTSFNQSEDDAHDFYNFNFSVPAGATIEGIEAHTNGALGAVIAGTRLLCLGLSWDGGTSWTAAQSSGNFADTDTTDRDDTYGGATDTWGRTWSASELSNGNFRVRVMVDYTNSQALAMLLDLLEMKVYYHYTDSSTKTLAYNASDASGNSNYGLVSSATRVTKEGCLFEGSCLQFNTSGSVLFSDGFESVDFRTSWCPGLGAPDPALTD